MPLSTWGRQRHLASVLQASRLPCGSRCARSTVRASAEVVRASEWAGRRALLACRGARQARAAASPSAGHVPAGQRAALRECINITGALASRQRVRLGKQLAQKAKLHLHGRRAAGGVGGRRSRRRPRRTAQRWRGCCTVPVRWPSVPPGLLAAALRLPRERPWTPEKLLLVLQRHPAARGWVEAVAPQEPSSHQVSDSMRRRRAQRRRCPPRGGHTHSNSI